MAGGTNDAVTQNQSACKPRSSHFNDFTQNRS